MNAISQDNTPHKITGIPVEIGNRNSPLCGWVIGKRFLSETRLEQCPDIWHFDGAEIHYLTFSDSDSADESPERSFQDVVYDGVALLLLQELVDRNVASMLSCGDDGQHAVHTAALDVLRREGVPSPPPSLLEPLENAIRDGAQAFLKELTGRVGGLELDAARHDLDIFRR